MAKRSYCGQRKGKRDCPALGSICTPYCGKHRGRETDCPEDCVYLHPSGGSTGGLTNCLARLTRFVERDTDWVREASDAYFPAERQLDEWEVPMFSGFVSWGYEAANGERGIDRFLREHGDSLDRDERDVFEALQRTWISLFRIEEVRRDVGLRLKDLLSDEEVFVRERLGTQGQAVGVSCWAGLFATVVTRSSPAPVARYRRHTSTSSGAPWKSPARRKKLTFPGCLFRGESAERCRQRSRC